MGMGKLRAPRRTLILRAARAVRWVAVKRARLRAAPTATPHSQDRARGRLVATPPPLLCLQVVGQHLRGRRSLQSGWQRVWLHTQRCERLQTWACFRLQP